MLSFMSSPQPELRSPKNEVAFNVLCDFCDIPPPCDAWEQLSALTQVCCLHHVSNKLVSHRTLGHVKCRLEGWNELVVKTPNQRKKTYAASALKMEYGPHLVAGSWNWKRIGLWNDVSH
jgi:hypothetical protein